VAAATASLLTASLDDALHDRVIDVRVSNNNAATSITETNRDGRALLLVADLRAREITPKNGLTSHSAGLHPIGGNNGAC
jgi:hypothetical protein